MRSLLHINLCMIMSYLLPCDIYAFSFGPWEIASISETKIGTNKILAPKIVLLSKKSDENIPIQPVNAKSILKNKQRIILLVSLKTQSEMEVPIILEGGIGIIVAKTNLASAQSIWPREEIHSIDDREFLDIINMTNRFKTLVNKKGSEPKNALNGGRTFDFEKDVKILTESSIWQTITATSIRRAHYAIPSQATRLEKNWGCGPNSAARSLIMLGHESVDFDNFVNSCPKSWSLIADIGPTPKQLAKYIGEYDSSQPVYAQFENYFSDILPSIKQSIDSDRPVIALIIRSTTSMHYVNIIGYNDTEKKFAVMDTDKTIYWLHYDDLKFWMDARWHFLQLFCIDDFNIIKV